MNNFPVVCVGGSAGGLDAYIKLLQNLPPDLGVAIVIVNHITIMPTQLHDVLPRFSKMSVELILEQLQIVPNRVFIIPSNRDLHVANGEFRLKPISKPRGWPDVIRVFLRSLADCWDGKVIAVIVSGYDGDGADAPCAIKAVGGITIAQKIKTAKQPDMPESAIASGCIDFVLSPQDIAEKIVHIAAAELGPSVRCAQNWPLQPNRVEDKPSDTNIGTDLIFLSQTPHALGPRAMKMSARIAGKTNYQWQNRAVADVARILPTAHYATAAKSAADSAEEIGHKNMPNLQTIQAAIKTRQLLSFTYNGIAKVVQPAAVGVSHAGHNIMRCYQVQGAHKTGGRSWDLCELSKITNLRASGSFSSNPPGYKRGDRSMNTIFAEL